jgi:ferric-dicitrate binding protein FerR (iron transport regulator)
VRRSSGARFQFQAAPRPISLVSILICLAVLPIVVGSGRRDDSQTIAAGNGGILTIRLPDGSRAKLLNGATVRYRRDFPQRRRLWLSGQAKFDVVPGREFALWTETAFVTTLDAEFEVRAMDRETTFVATRAGIVRLRALNEDNDPAYRSVTVGAGQHALAARMVGARPIRP